MRGLQQARIKPAKAGAGTIIIGIVIIRQLQPEGSGERSHQRLGWWRKHQSTVLWKCLNYGLDDAGQATPVRVLHPHRANALLAYHTPHTHLELECGTQGIRYQRSLCVHGHMLLEGLLDAGQEGVYSLLALGMGHCLGDMQKTD